MANKLHQKLCPLHLFIVKTNTSNRLTTQQIIDKLSYIGIDIKEKLPSEHLKVWLV